MHHMIGLILQEFLHHVLQAHLTLQWIRTRALPAIQASIVNQVHEFPYIKREAVYWSLNLYFC